MVKKILLADDDPDIRFILKTALIDAGYDVALMPAGHPIVEGRCEWPDLFILDRSLPVIDGMALSKYLKVKKDTRDIPIILLSSNHKLRNEAKNAGVEAFLEKPLDLKLLLQTVRQQLHLSGANGVLKDQPSHN